MTNRKACPSVCYSRCDGSILVRKLIAPQPAFEQKDAETVPVSGHIFDTEKITSLQFDFLPLLAHRFARLTRLLTHSCRVLHLVKIAELVQADFIKRIATLLLNLDHPYRDDDCLILVLSFGMSFKKMPKSVDSVKLASQTIPWPGCKRLWKINKSFIIPVPTQVRLSGLAYSSEHRKVLVRDSNSPHTRKEYMQGLLSDFTASSGFQIAKLYTYTSGVH